MFNSIHVGFHRICGQLHAACQARSQITHKGSGVRAVAFSHSVRRDKLAVGIECNIGPEVTILSWIIGRSHVALLLSDVAPDLVHLEVTAFEPAHFRVHEEC